MRLFFLLVARSLSTRRELLMENLALRQQLAVLRRRRPLPRFAASDRLFWLTLRRLWPRRRRAMILVEPETILRWHWAGFKAYWTWLSRHRASAGRKRVNILRDLIYRMVAENPTWERRGSTENCEFSALISPSGSYCALDAQGTKSRPSAGRHS